MEEPRQMPETAVSRLRNVTAELIRPVPYNPNVPPPPKKQEEKPNYIRALKNGAFFILALAILGAVSGFVRVVMRLPTYGAHTTVELTSPNQTFMGRGSLDPQGSDGYVVNTINIQTQLRVIASPGTVRRAVERIALESAPLAPPSSGFLNGLRNRFGLMPQDSVSYFRSSIGGASGSVVAKQVGATHLIDISCESISGEVAANFVNAVASEYISQRQQFFSSSATRTIQWLSTQLEDSKGKLDEANAKLQDFIKKQGLDFVLDQNTLADSKLKDLQGSLSTSQADRITKQTRYELAKSSPVDSLPEILDDGTLKGLNGALVQLRRERAQLTATLTPDHVKVKRIDAQIDELESTLTREKGNLVKRIENEYDAALQREKLLNKAYTSQARAVANQSDGAAQYAEYKRNAEALRASYDHLQTEYNSMAVLAAVPTNNVRVIDTAVPVHIPLAPLPKRDVAIFTAAGAALAAALLVVRETIRVKKLSLVFASPGDTSPILNVPELGTIPAFQLDGSVRRRATFRFRGLRAGERTERESVPDLTSWSKQPFLAESIRHAVTSILVRSSNDGHQIIVVTSASPEEGKTTLIGNLGVAMAETGRRVLMVDADLRAPRLHNLFRSERKHGLLDVYDSDVPIDDLPLKDYVKITNIPNLSLLTSGEVEHQKAGEVFFSRRFRELFSRLRREYDFVLVDTAPTLQFSDARLLGQFADGAILVVRSGVSSRENVQLTAKRITEDGIPLIGTILNQWQPGLSGSALDEYFLGTYDSRYGPSSKAS